MKGPLSFRKSLIAKALSNVWQRLPVTLSTTQKKMLLTGILLTNVLLSSFCQKTSVFLSSYDSCHVRPPRQTSFAIRAVGMAPMVRVAYVIPSNRTAQSDGVANLQHAIKLGQQFFKKQMEQNGFGAKTYIFETEADGVTPLIHVVPVAETDEYLRGDIWGRTIQAASDAGISLWADGEVWVVIPEAHSMLPDGTITGGVALGAGIGSGSSPGVSMIGSNALPLFRPGIITDDTPYDGKVLSELGPYPMKQDVTFAWFEGSTLSSLASSWLGALWHETGHAFGLPHDFRNDNNFHGNLMGNGLRGTRGSLFPEKYQQDYTRLEYTSALVLNVSHYFNSDKKMVTYGPTLTYANPVSVTPQQGLVHLSFQASDPDSLSFAYLRYGGDMVAEIVLQDLEADTVFAVPYFAQGDNQYTIVVYDKQGNITYTGTQFNVPAGNNQAPIPFIRIDPPVPGLNQPIVLNATQSYDVDDDQSSILAAWDVDNDGQFDTEPSTNKTVQYLYENPGNYLIRVKLTDPSGAQTISTAVSIKIPGEKKIAVESFSLIDAENDEAVADLEEGLVIDPTVWEGKTFSVRANTSPGTIDRVEFNLEGPISHHQVDSEPPYSLFGDAQGNFIGRELLPGEYQLTATPFSSEVGVALTVSFRVRDRSTIISDKSIGGTSDDILFGALSTSDGGYLLAGNSSSNASGDKSENSRGASDYWTVKIDAQYNKLWDKTFGGGNSETLRNVIPAQDGGYLLIGDSDSDQSGDKSEDGKGGSDYWVVKIDNNGNKMWDKTFGGVVNEALFTATSTSDGGYLLGGFSESDAYADKSENSKGGRDFWVVKLDSQGNKVWDKTIGGAASDQLNSISATNGGWLLFGNSESDISGDKSQDSKGSNDYWIVKIDSQGNKEWDKTFGGGGEDRLSNTIAASDGGWLLSGYSESGISGDKSQDSKGSTDYWIVKIDNQGNKEWDKTFGGSGDDSPTITILTPDRGYLLGGISNSNISGDKSENSKGDWDQWMVKIDAAGNKVWDKTLGGSNSEHLSSITLTVRGSYLLGGASNSNASGDKSENSKGGFDYWIVEFRAPNIPAVTSLTLVNAHSDQEIKELKDGNVISLTEVGSSLLDIRANITAEKIDKVDFDLKGPINHHQTERIPPYALFGDLQGDFNGRTLLPGAYTLTVTHYVNDNKQPSVTISFSVTPGITFTLMNAHTDQEIKGLGDGDVISLTEVGTKFLDVRANINGENINKVIFDLNGPVTHHQVERESPYALFGNNQHGFNGRKFLPGAYTLTVIPYVNDIKVTELTISFTVTDGSAVSGFTLIDATLDKSLGTLSEGDVIDLSLLKGHKLSVRADTQPMYLDKVVLALQGPIVFSGTELYFPYALFGDITAHGRTDYTGAIMSPGTYTLTATPYAGGVRGAPKTITFKVISGGSNDTASRQVEVYPVPASKEINIRHSGEAEQYHMILLNVDGNVLLRRTLSQEPVEQLDVSSLRKGIHYLKIVGPEGTQVIRLVIE